MLSKSQEDEETIEEAIARLIVAHNANAEAHLASGGSLSSHKASVIIDHVVGSVLGDKFSSKEFALHFPFESLDEYSKSVAVMAVISLIVNVFIVYSSKSSVLP
jgi:hypothetical protein